MFFYLRHATNIYHTREKRMHVINVFHKTSLNSKYCKFCGTVNCPTAYWYILFIFSVVFAEVQVNNLFCSFCVGV